MTIISNTRHGATTTSV